MALLMAMAAAGHGFAQTPPAVTVGAALEPLLAAARLPDARLGIVVMEAASGRVVYQHDADVPLNPASNAKVLTAAAALSILGPDRRFSTGLYGNLQGPAVAGPLVLRGNGDPSLRTSDLYELARQAWAAGVRRVEGDLVVDDTAFGSQHLPPAFEQQPRESAAFRASVGAVSVDENAIALHVRPGPAVGRPAFVTADPPGYLEIESTLTTADGAAAAVTLDVATGPAGRERARVSGRFPLGAPTATYYRRLDNPGLAAGYAMRAMLEEVGVRVLGAVRVGAANTSGLARLARRESAPLSVLLYEVGKDSNNFTAEMTLLAVAAEPVAGGPSPPVTFQRGAERLVDWARRAGVDVEGMTVRNGSGLYDANRLTARQVAQVLRAAWRDPAIRDEYVAQLAVGGVDGTLRGRLRDAGAPRCVRAKTGTLDDVVALSGYVLADDPGRALVFSVLANNVRGHVPAARELADRVAAQLAQAARSEAAPSAAR